MSLNMLGMGLVFTAKDLTNGTIQKIAGQFGGLDNAALKANASYQRSISVLGAGLGLMLAGVAALGSAFALADAGEEFSQKIAQVGAISKASKEDLLQLRNAAVGMGLKGAMPDDSAEALEALASQGFDAKKSLELLTPVIQLAQGGMISMGSAAETVTSAVHVFGLDMEKAKTVSDKLLAISNTTALAAGDLQLALGTVGRGAALTGQSIDEMLISMGLVKNTGVDASVAAQSVSSALIFMAGRAEKFKALGLSVTDAQGKFKPFLQVVTETAGVLESKYTDQAERAAMATELFSRFGLQAYSAIVKQLGTGIKNETTGAILKGAEAVAYLRHEMENSAGTAEEFRKRMLDTFAGQKMVLRSSMRALVLELSEPFQQALKPVVKAAAETVGKIVQWIQSIPAEVKGPLVQMVLLFGVVATAAGGIIAAFAAFAAVKPFLIGGLLALKGMAAALLPVIIYIGIIVGVLASFRYAVEKNLGGIGDLWERFKTTISLGVQGLVQLFTQGGFSGALQQELNKAGNGGIKWFLIRLYQIGFRVMQFFRGIREGVAAALENTSVWSKMTVAFEALGRVLSKVGQRSAYLASALPSEAFAQKGAMIGLVLGKVVEFIGNLITIVVTVITGIVQGFRIAFATFAPIFENFMPLLSEVGSEFMALLRTLGLVNEGVTGAGGFWYIFGQIIGVIGGTAVALLVGALELVVGAIGAVIVVVRTLIEWFGLAWEQIKETALAIEALFIKVKNSIMNTIDAGIVGMSSIIDKIPASIRPMVVAGLNLNGIPTDGAAASARIRNRDGAYQETLRNLYEAQHPKDGVAASLRAAESQDMAVQTAAMGRVADMVAKQKKDRGEFGGPTVLVVDGEKLAETTQRSGAASARRGFNVVSPETE